MGTAKRELAYPIMNNSSVTTDVAESERYARRSPAVRAHLPARRARMLHHSVVAPLLHVRQRRINRPPRRRACSRSSREPRRWLWCVRITVAMRHTPSASRNCLYASRSLAVGSPARASRSSASLASAHFTSVSMFSATIRAHPAGARADNPIGTFIRNSWNADIYLLLLLSYSSHYWPVVQNLAAKGIDEEHCAATKLG